MTFPIWDCPSFKGHWIRPLVRFLVWWARDGVPFKRVIVLLLWLLLSDLIAPALELLWLSRRTQVVVLLRFMGFYFDSGAISLREMVGQISEPIWKSTLTGMDMILDKNVHLKLSIEWFKC